MNIILGIDPGSRITGYGLIKTNGNRHLYLASGCITMKAIAHPERLRQIFINLCSIIQQYQPNEAAIEQVFMSQNASAALKLGQARGAAIVAAAHSGLSVAEYSARSIKQAVVGYGAATKEQVQQMVKLLLGLSGLPQVDAADALAVAICHAHSHSFKVNAKLSAGLMEEPIS